MPKIQLSFHTTFPLKKEDVIQVFRVAATQELGLENSIDNLMISTGLGNRKIPPMISWATRGGLLADKRLSKAGEIVFRFDPHLESIVTDWLMHFYLSFGKYGLEKPFDIPAEWGGWTYFVYEFLPQYPSFTWENFSYHFASVFDEENRNTLVKNIRIMLRAYTEPYGLAKCQFVQKNKDKSFTSGQAILPNPYLIGYFLAQLWYRDFGDSTSVLTKDVLEQTMGLTGVLGIVSSQLESQLNILESYGIIEQRKTVTPWQIVRRWSNPYSLLEKAYERI